MAASTLRFNTNVVTGSLNGVSNASVTGNSNFMGTSFLKIDHLSAYLIVTAATSSVVVKPYWQVSNDNSTFKTVQNDPNCILQLGIATGAENVTEVLPAPECVKGYKYARCMLAVSGATGLTADLYSIGYSYRQQYV
ncbi:MAG TPA: hypothetical protein VM686_31055 [Polyangiaceae bacterium]|nr:hypothetical protein [Polyangiaceae bacterium]